MRSKLYELRTVYSASIEKAMQLYYGRLGEKDRRQYAAVEAIKLGNGGVTYISRVLSIDRSTIIDGKKELLALTADEPMVAGKKKTDQPQVQQLLTALIENHWAGSPTDNTVYWISLRPWKIATLLYEQHHMHISHGVVKRQLKTLGYGYRSKPTTNCIL